MVTERIRRLCYVSTPPVVERGGRFFAFPGSVRLIEPLVLQFREVTLLCPAFYADAFPSAHARLAEIRFPNVDVCALPICGGRVWRSLRHVSILWRALAHADLACLDLPHEASFLAFLICKLTGKPFFVQILGEWGESILLSGRRCLVRRLKAGIAEWMVRVMVRYSRLVLAQGRSLYDRYAEQNRDAVKTDIVHSTLSREVFHERRDELFHNPIRLLSVSSLIHRKGLDVLVEALRLMSSRGLGVEWWCVGDGPCRQSLAGQARALGVEERVQFFGHVPFGPELLELER